MKATGIVRRIDDLGRVVIPKEIRRTMRIREGDPLEIFTDREGEVILKKYSPLSDLSEFATEYVDSLFESLMVPVLLSDRDEMIAAAGVAKKDYLNRRLSHYAEDCMKERRVVRESEETTVELVPGLVESVKAYCVAPILVGGDVIGAVYMLSKIDELSDTAVKSAEIAALFLGKQMEN